MHALRRPGAEGDHGAPPVLGILPPFDEAVVFQVARQLARRWEREVELARQLADAALSLGSDLREQPHVSPTERRLAAHQLQQLRCRAPPCPEPAHHAAEEAAQFLQLLLISYHHVTIIGSEERR